MFGTHPKLEVKPTKTDQLVMRIGWVIIGLNFVVLLLFYFDLPNTIPIHFNLRGEADGFGSKMNLWGLPILSLGLYYAVWMLTKRMKPWNYNYPTKVTDKNAPLLYALSIRMMVWINLGIVLLFLAISLHSIVLTQKIENINIAWIPIALVICITLYPFVVIYQMLNIPKT